MSNQLATIAPPPPPPPSAHQSSRDTDNNKNNNNDFGTSFRETETDTDAYYMETSLNEQLIFKSEAQKYKPGYRWLKTMLLIVAWISYSLNFEMIGPTFEDFRHFLGVNYTSVSFSLVMRNLGFFVFTFVFGLFFDRVSKCSELLLAISSITISTSIVARHSYHLFSQFFVHLHFSQHTKQK